jgi:hypothetical protein
MAITKMALRRHRKEEGAVTGNWLENVLTYGRNSWIIVSS